MSMFSGVDWSKAAAAWVSQKQKFEREKESVNQQSPNSLLQSVQFSHFNQLNPVMPYAGSLPQQLSRNDMPLAMMQMQNSLSQALSSTLKSGSVMKQAWLSSNVKKPLIFGSSEYSNSLRSASKEAIFFDDINKLLPIIEPSENNAEEQALINSVKQRVMSILMNVTESLVNLLAQETLNEAHLLSAQQQQQQTQQLQQQNFQNSMNLTGPNGIPSRSAPAVIFPHSTSRALQLQLSYAAIPVQPVILGEAGQALEEDNSDIREEMENNGMPFISFAEPVKGLFKRPPDEILLPEERKHVGRFNDQCIRVVCYSNLGKNLGEIELNGRYAIIFGSNPRQANVLDSHASVYSQHCAIGLGYKTKSQSSSKHVVPCSLYLFPLGGSTKFYHPHQIAFVRFHQNIPADPSSSQGPYDTCADGDRKREIPIGSQVYIQLGSSQRYYLIDASCWRKSYVSCGSAGISRFYTVQSLERLNEMSDSIIEIEPEPVKKHSLSKELNKPINLSPAKETESSKNPVEKIIEESIKKEKDDAITKARLYASEHLLIREKKAKDYENNSDSNINDKKVLHHGTSLSHSRARKSHKRRKSKERFSSEDHSHSKSDYRKSKKKYEDKKSKRDISSDRSVYRDESIKKNKHRHCSASSSQEKKKKRSSADKFDENKEKRNKKSRYESKKHIDYDSTDNDNFYHKKSSKDILENDYKSRKSRKPSKKSLDIEDKSTKHLKDKKKSRKLSIDSAKSTKSDHNYRKHNKSMSYKESSKDGSSKQEKDYASKYNTEEFYRKSDNKEKKEYSSYTKHGKSYKPKEYKNKHYRESPESESEAPYEEKSMSLRRDYSTKEHSRYSKNDHLRSVNSDNSVKKYKKKTKLRYHSLSRSDFSSNSDIDRVQKSDNMDKYDHDKSKYSKKYKKRSQKDQNSTSKMKYEDSESEYKDYEKKKSSKKKRKDYNEKRSHREYSNRDSFSKESPR